MPNWKRLPIHTPLRRISIFCAFTQDANPTMVRMRWFCTGFGCLSHVNIYEGTVAICVIVVTGRDTVDTAAGAVVCIVVETLLTTTREMRDGDDVVVEDGDGAFVTVSLTIAMFHREISRTSSCPKNIPLLSRMKLSVSDG